jgi:CheY-like chemotaxis protein
MNLLVNAHKDGPRVRESSGDVNFFHDKLGRVCQLAVVVAPSVDEAAALLATPSSMREAAHVLVVGLEEAMLELIAFIFQRAAIESISTSSIASALHAFEARTPAVIVVDSYGMQATSQLTDGVGLPVVVLTADAQDDELPTQAVGHVEYLRKPFTGKELVARVRAHLGRREAGLATAIAER